MMQPHQLELVKATVPVLEQHGEIITHRFYEFLLRDHPELRNIFNPANQKNGSQARSLAASICTYAAHIDRLDELGGMVQRISHKHSSLEVQPEHYPLVGEALLRAIRAVLGEAATPEILDAWAAAYDQLARIMIDTESQLYEEAAHKPGGWRGFKPLSVERKAEESVSLTSFYLEPVDDQPLPLFQPGQYVSLKLDVPGFEHTQIRQYSLSDAPGRPYYRIGVKREVASADSPHAPAGLVSNYLHDHVKEGDEVLVHAPNGDFVLDTRSDRPVVLLSGGAGLTPVQSMLEDLVARRDSRAVVYAHAASGKAHHAYRDRLNRLCHEHPSITRAVFYAHVSPEDERGLDYDEAGLISAERLREYLPEEDADYYVCGPNGFMSAAQRIMDQLGVPEDRLHTEVFSPTPSFSSASTEELVR